MRRVCLAVGLLASAGCSKILGLDDVTRSDAGNVDAPIDTPTAPPNTVIGRSYFHYVTPTEGDLPRDLSGITVQALIPDSTQPTKFKVVTGTGKADGTFSISPVPDGTEYLLKIGASYFVTSSHVIDQRFEIGYRAKPPPTPLSGMAFYDFNLSNLSRVVYGPEQVYDELEIDSFSLGYQGFAGPPQNNATTFAGSYDWSTGFPVFTTSTSVGTPDSSQNDDVWLLHFRSQPVLSNVKRPHNIRTLLSAYELTNVTLTPGAYVAQTGAATLVPQQSTVSASISRGLFDAGFDGYTSLGASSQGIGQLEIGIAVTPVNTVTMPANLVTIGFDDWTRSPNLTETIATSYGDPFPTSWLRWYYYSYWRFRWLLFPGTTGARLYGSNMYREAVFTGGNPTLTPSVLPPGNVKIANQPAGAGGKIAFDGVTPVTVTWNGVAAAKMYSVRIDRVFANGTATRTSNAAVVTTTNTSVDVPAEAFTGGEFFAISVTAIQTPSDYAAGQISPNGMPYAQASYPSGMFRLSASCGNGTVDANEQCDTSGESATCDVDCTTRICGDGLRNMTAGEACDTIKDTPGCDSDCTAPMCGDGHVNTQAGEDCDDGNMTADGNGCSATCKYNNICGNGIVESAAGEQCDPGTVGVNTATCDSDCTTPSCGDGHPNLPAGEMCDDGNQDETDGCKSNCAP